MQALRDTSDESAILMRRAGDAATVCIDRAESRHPVRLQVELGQTMPMHVGSAGRVLLAALPDDRRASYLADVLPTLTDERMSEALSDEALARVSENGWTESFDEFDEGVWGCAAAISDDNGVVAAIGMPGLSTASTNPRVGALLLPCAPPPTLPLLRCARRQTRRSDR